MAPDEDTNQIFCAHCGTTNDAGIYACDRCGERIYLPDPLAPPPMGLAECPKCLVPNESRASYCVKCGSSMANAARISVLSGGDANRQAPHARPGGIRISSTSRDEASSQAEMREQALARREAERQERERQSVESKARFEGERTDREKARASAQDMQRRQSELDPETNDSGTRSAKLPRSARGWNTAAFLLGPVWGPANGVWYGVIGLAFLFLPFLDMPTRMVLYLAFGALLGIKGNELAWRAKRWSSVEHFKKTQQMWMMFALIVNIFLLAGVFALFVRG